MTARLLGAVLALALLAGGAATAQAKPPLDAAIAKAADAAGAPRAWVEAVVEAESGGDPHALSTSGAMGLMQLMPRTWREFRARLGLGDDPFDVGDNLLAGATYLRDLFERFGAPGFLAAYHAGPSRYGRHLAGLEPLPGATRAYVARLTGRLGASLAAETAQPDLPLESRLGSPLFPGGAAASSLFPLRTREAPQ